MVIIWCSVFMIIQLQHILKLLRAGNNQYRKEDKMELYLGLLGFTKKKKKTVWRMFESDALFLSFTDLLNSFEECSLIKILWSPAVIQI